MNLLNAIFFILLVTSNIFSAKKIGGKPETLGKGVVLKCKQASRIEIKKKKKEEDFQTQFSTSSSGLIRSLDHFL